MKSKQESDEKYGHLYKICNNQPKTTPEIKVIHSYNYKHFQKKILKNTLSRNESIYDGLSSTF